MIDIFRPASGAIIINIRWLIMRLFHPQGRYFIGPKQSALEHLWVYSLTGDSEKPPKCLKIEGLELCVDS